MNLSDLDPRLTHGSLVPPESAHKLHLDRISHFCRHLNVTNRQTDRQTDRQTKRPCYSVCINSLHAMRAYAIRPYDIIMQSSAILRGFRVLASDKLIQIDILAD